MARKKVSLFVLKLGLILVLGLAGCARFVTSGENRRLEINLALKSAVDRSGAYYVVFNRSGLPVEFPLVSGYLNSPDWNETYNYELAREYIDTWTGYLVLREDFYRFYQGPFGTDGEAQKYALDGFDSSRPGRFYYQLDLTLPQLIEGQKLYFNVLTVRPDRTLADTLAGDYSLSILAGETVLFSDADGDVSGSGDEACWDILEGSLRVQ